MSFQVSDVVVVGGGVIGGLIARNLAVRGLRVSILDASHIGAEASGAAAGMLAPSGEFTKASQATTLALRSVELWPELVADLERETGLDLDYRKSGAVEIAFSEKEAIALEQRAALQSQIGIKSEQLSLNEVRWLVPRLTDEPIAAARYFLDDAIIDPKALMAAVRQSLMQHRVNILESRRASYVQLEEVIQIMADGEVFFGRAAVLCAGAWSGQIQLPFGNMGVEYQAPFPVKGHLISYNLPSGLVHPILRNKETYLLQRKSGKMVAGSTLELKGFDRSVDESVVMEVHHRVGKLYPTLTTLKPQEAWSGLRPGISGEPVIMRYSGTNLWLSYGHYRNGILMAPGNAELICNELITSLERS